MDPPLVDSVFEYTVILSTARNNSIKVITRLVNDTASLRLVGFGSGNHCVISQSLIFMSSDSVLKSVNVLNHHRNDFSSKIGKSEVRLPKYVFTDIGLCFFKDKDIFYLYGYGLSNGSAELVEYYDCQGQRVCSGMYERNEEKEDCVNIEFQRWIDEEQEEPIEIWHVFPPISAGERSND
jgi:hypothetical protein